MKMKRIRAENVFDKGRLVGAKDVLIKDGVVHDIAECDATKTFDVSAHLITPAFTDLQVNGGGGVLLNTTPTADGIKAILDAHRALGTGWCLPTVITDAPEVLAQTVTAAIEAKDQPGCAGLHIEGPHINVAKKGTHNPAFIRPFEEATHQAVERLRSAGIPVMITLAPECVGDADIKRLVEVGAVVSAGHSMATFEEATRASELGVRCATHLYNAMPVPSSRDPGLAVATILGSGVFGFIADGIHVSWPMLDLAFRAHKNADRMFIVSDAMSTVGGPDTFNLYGQDIKVKDGALVNAQGSLAGAHIDMRTSVANLLHHTDWGLEAILRMATVVPRSTMGLEGAQSLAGSRLGEWIALDQQFDLISL